MNISEILKKRVLGVPVLYLAGVAVLILAYVAWKMKATTDITDGGADVTGDPSAASDLPSEGDDPYGSLATQGTVTVVQQPAVTTPEPEEKSNEVWAKKGAEWIVGHPTPEVNPSGAAAIAALNHFLQGEDLSYDETQIVNAVIREWGQPPEGVTVTGKVTTDKPAQRQFSVFPGTHTVKGSNDNTYAKLAGLYYGSASVDNINLIAGNNPGREGSMLSVGTPVKIPLKRPPRYIKATNSMKNAPDIAKKNGITVAQLWAYNPGKAFPVPVGTSVRIS